MSYFKNLAQENNIPNALVILLLGYNKEKKKQYYGSYWQSWTGRKYESVQNQSDCVYRISHLKCSYQILRL